MNRDELEGKAEALKGKVKRGVGHLVDDPELTEEGNQDEAAGRAQEGIGRAKRKIGEAVENVGESIKK